MRIYDEHTRKKHIRNVREFLGVNGDQKERKILMKITAMDAAQTKENIGDIINVIIAQLIKSCYELPSFKVLLRLAMASRKIVNFGLFQKIETFLSDEKKIKIDNLFKIKPNNDDLQWALIKQEPKRPSNNNIKEFLNHLTVMISFRDMINVNVDFIQPARMEQ